MSFYLENLPGIAFLAYPDALAFLKTELKERYSSPENLKFTCWGDILYIDDVQDIFCDTLKDSAFEIFDKELPYWARTTFLKPFLLHFESISQAATALKNIQRSWAPYQYQKFRRAALIQEKLPYINLKPRKFPTEIPKSLIGIYTLLDDKTILGSAKTSSFLPAGRLEFIEDHENPPSRAYLKIQESLTMAQLLFNAKLPDSSSRCFEAGACPGGWTWVLVNLGAKVYAVDRTELSPELMKNPLVSFRAHDAFTLKPSEIGKCDWVFSDVICYPERLLEWVKGWLESGLTKNMICTIKMQGAIDYSIVQKFATIPNSRVIHLNYNKHELTWIHCESE